MPVGGKALGTFSGILLIAAGLAIAAAGAGLLSRVVKTGELAEFRNGSSNGGADLSAAELLATADRLAAASAPARTADEAGALTFLYYAAAQASRRVGDLAAAAGEMET